VDKSKACRVETSFDKFEIVPREKKPGGRVFSRPQVNFIGDIEALRKQPFVQVIDVTQEVAVPYHAGMRPYEQVAFQWSCHTIPTRGANLVHQEWINVDEAYPNFEFARSLQKVVSGTGTVFVWSPFGRSALNDVRRQLIQYRQQDRALAEWLDAMVEAQGNFLRLLSRQTTDDPLEWLAQPAPTSSDQLNLNCGF